MKFLTSILFASLFTSQVSSDLGSLIGASNEFALKLYKSLPPNENIFCSPASIFIALGMLYRGARGTTAQQMQQALAFDPTTVNQEYIHQEFAELLISFRNPSNEYILQIANAIVSSSEYPISEEYQEALKIYYGAKTKKVNFRTGKKDALKEINGWISEKTKGKIPELLKELEDDTVMVLLNAIYFKGVWKTQFNISHTKNETFYSRGKDAKSVPMMNVEENFFYRRFRQQKFHSLKLPYKGEDISMLLLLPFEKNGLKALEEALTFQKLKEIISGLTKEKVNVTIPKFKLEDGRKLNENLKKLGMKEAFQSGRADFRAIDESRRIFVSNVVHKAMVEVNEKGSEAAAGTAVISNSRIGNFISEFRAEHPFIFLILDERKEMILFMGRVNQL